MVVLVAAAVVGGGVGVVVAVVRVVVGAYAVKVSARCTDFIDFFEKILDKGNKTLQDTPKLLPVLAKAGVVDSGGRGLMLIYQGYAAVLRGEDISLTQASMDNDANSSENDCHDLSRDLTFAYCVRFTMSHFRDDCDEHDLDSFKRRINRIGDTALIGGIILCSYFMYQYAPDRSLTTLSFIDMTTVSTLVYVYSSKIIFWLICGLFILAALVKSAQFLFYPWLQDAMEAKLPVSALLHSATLLAAGLFVTLRLMPLYTLDVRIIKIIAILGLFTAIVCSFCACAQKNPKKTLAYSTSAQFGLMYMGLGLLNIKACLALFIAHAFIKSMLFITLPQENRRWDYPSFIIFLIGGLSLSGLIFAGMISKELLTVNFGNTAKILFCIVSFMTAFYIMRIALITADENELEKRKPNLWEFLSAICLLILNIGFYLYLRRFDYKIAEPFWFALFGWICVYLLYINKGFYKIPLFYPLAYNGLYLDKFYTGFCTKAYNLFTKGCNWFDTKVFGEYRPILWLSKAGVKIAEFIETEIMNGGINVITNCAKGFSKLDIRVQNGNIQRYNAYAFIIITIIITCLIFAYIAIISYLGGF